MAVPPQFDAKSFLANLPEQPGVYRMLGGAAQVLYVGKAKSLKKRVSSYFQKNLSSPRIALMVSQIAAIETTVTRSEAEALLLENNLIKRLNPRFNIVFRDDKSYPYIVITRQDTPRLGFFRGSPDRKADYFGPYPSAGAVRESLHLLQKMFRLRTCEDSVFANRSRPCLLFQIRRCSGPCVGMVAADQYAEDVRLAKLFLDGRGLEVIERLSRKMEDAAARLAFEQAALYRDQIQALRRLHERQFVAGFSADDVDVVVVVREHGKYCINLAMVRGGQHLGDKPMFPEHADDASPAEVLGGFLRQHYLVHPLPHRIVVNDEVADDVREDLQSLAAHTLALPRAEAQRAWVAMAVENGRLAILARIGAAYAQTRRCEALRDALDLADIPERIECFDISHTQGEAPVASCVVYHGTGMRRSEYRRFNIRDVTPGDDYAAIRQAVSRRYDKLPAGEGTRPDLLLIDGGKGQVRAAAAALAELGIADLPLIGVAKGEARTPGREQLVYADERKSLELGGEHPALQLIQEIRDEAHRFAVSGHRGRREKARRTSVLEDIPGIGAARRRALINHFGGLQGIREATVEQLAGAPGISRALADKLFRNLHS